MLNYRTIGSGENLVLIHGFGFCGDIFKPLIAKLQNQYKITILDLPGHGGSCSVIGFDNWIKKIFTIIPKNSTILGWSLGGLVAIKLAKLTSAKKIILCGSTPKFIQDKSWDYGIKKDNFISFANNINTNIEKGLTRFISLQGLEKTQIKELKKIIINNLPVRSGLNNALDILLKENLITELLEIDNIEVVLGKKDTIVPVAIQEFYLKNNIKTTILDCGHLPFLHPDFIIN